MEKGQVLVCKELHSRYDDYIAFIEGNHYIISNIVFNSDKNVNVYIGGEDGISTPFSLYRDYDMLLPHSSLYLYDYFVSLAEVRQEKLKQLGL